jgi:glucokinase
VNVFQFLSHARIGKASAAVARELKSNPSPAAISQAALKGSCDRCARALELFVTLYGRGGGESRVEISGDRRVVRRRRDRAENRPALRRPNFIKAFREKGPMKKLLERIPVRVILNDQTALLGAARTAVEMG